MQGENTEGLDTARDDWEQHWVEFAHRVPSNPARRYREELVVRALERDGGVERVLDIGSGTGDLAGAIVAALPQAELLGLELSKSGVELSRTKVPAARFEARDLMVATTPPPEQQGWATHAVCSEVLEHVDDPETLLRNVVPYLAPGCLLVVTVPGGPKSAFDRHIGHRRHFRPDELRTLLERVGFEVRHATGAGFPFFNLYRLAVMARGKRLASAKGGTSLLARLALGLFGLLFRLNLDASRWGWQTVAHARLPRAA
ncbi:MAG TPA: class I SAM-dependent methyltransferase [Gaiellaceae bacterium]|nr:class I SAM-dependent methyltransferase [Gaiellaceae bacterium]